MFAKTLTLAKNESITMLGTVEYRKEGEAKTLKLIRCKIGNINNVVDVECSRIVTTGYSTTLHNVQLFPK